MKEENSFVETGGNGGFILDGVRGVVDIANPETASAQFQSVFKRAPCDLRHQGRLRIVRVIALDHPGTVGSLWLDPSTAA